MNPKACWRPAGDLSPERLLAAYRRGIFPWYSAGQPVLWWSPNPREVLFPPEFKCSRSLAKTLRNRGFEVTFDRDFAAVVQACAARRENSTGTWITPEMHAAYCLLHQQGQAHSVEVWLEGGWSAGSTGCCWAACSSGNPCSAASATPRKWRSPASCERALVAGLQLIDCQLPTPHLRSLGSRPLSRAEFSVRVAEATAGPDVPLFESA